MLVHYKQYYQDNDERLIGAFFDSWLAKDRVWGVRLVATQGRNRRGGKHQYYVFPPEHDAVYRTYEKGWRISIKAFSDAEALEIANNDKRVKAIYKRLWEAEFSLMMAMG